MGVIPGFNLFLKNARKYGFSLFGLPKTGQTIEYVDEDDGHYQKGYPKTGARFTDNGDGTITDNATGLMWVKDGTGEGCNNGNTLLWAAAINFCKALNFAGHQDWRLPNVAELASILDYSKNSPAIDPIFTNQGNVNMWSSTTFFPTTTSAYRVAFGSAGTSYYSKTAGAYRVRPVRGA